MTPLAQLTSGSVQSVLSAYLPTLPLTERTIPTWTTEKNLNFDIRIMPDRIIFSPWTWLNIL